MSLDFHIYSPEEEITDVLFEEKNIQVFAKRDDQIHPFISGNKWRKLKWNLKAAKRENKNKLVTFGGAWSNHILATAAAAAKFGFHSIGIIRGEEITNPVLAIAKLYGMEIHFIDRETYRSKENYFNNNFGSKEHYFIDEGGRSDLGILGCKEIISELTQDYTHIITAAGTGTTAAGLRQGLDEKMFDTKLLIVPVLKSADFLKEDLNNWNIDNRNIQWIMDYHFGGYAKTNYELNQFINFFVSHTGILIEPTYTGKVCYALYDLIQKDHFPQGSKILFLHTGGMTGLLGHLNKM